MCTLIVGVDPLGPGTLVLAANRDEAPDRPSRPPGVLSERPRVVGGQDAVAGGTWLAVRERQAVVAVLNRRPRRGSPAPPPTRSRGLVALDVARTERSGSATLASPAFDRLRGLIGRARVAPFALAWLEPGASWVATHEPGAALERRALDPGWHVITHEDLDDATEPRTRRLLARLSSLETRAHEGPRDLEDRLLGLLGLHEHAAAGESVGQPAVCLHAGRVVTVSSTVASFAGGAVAYRHVEGRPCTERPRDYGHLLLAGAPGAAEPGSPRGSASS